jgi:GlpG protein
VIASCSISLLANFAKPPPKPLTRWLWIDAPSPHEEMMREVFGRSERPSLADVRRGQVWRLVSPIFLHLDWMHLIFNMLWLADLGAIIERRKGTWWLALVVLSTAVASNLVQYAWSGPGFGGMSGVVYALFGYVWMKGKFQPQEGMAVGQQTVLIMLVWLVACMTGLLGPIANAAHLVGLLGGMALGHAQYSWKRVKEMMKR